MEASSALERLYAIGNAPLFPMSRSGWQYWALDWGLATLRVFGFGWRISPEVEVAYARWGTLPEWKPPEFAYRQPSVQPQAVRK